MWIPSGLDKTVGAVSPEPHGQRLSRSRGGTEASAGIAGRVLTQSRGSSTSGRTFVVKPLCMRMELLSETPMTHHRTRGMPGRTDQGGFTENIVPCCPEDWLSPTGRVTRDVLTPVRPPSSALVRPAHLGRSGQRAASRALNDTSASSAEGVLHGARASHWKPR